MTEATSPARLGLITGSGFYELPQVVDRQITAIDTAYGSVDVTLGRWGEVPIAFLARHGSGHRIAPHAINYRANIAALAACGVAAILATAVSGGINPDMPNGSLVAISDFINFTSGRADTFFSGDGDNADQLGHTDMSHPYDRGLRQLLLAAASHAGVDMIDGGVYCATNGPRFETPAEIAMMGRVGGDLVGMTGYPEVALAVEAGLPYASVGVIANAAAGLGEEVLTVDDVIAVVNDCADGLHRVIDRFVGRLVRLHPMTAVRLTADYVVPVDGQGTVIPNGAVDVDVTGRITAVGPVAELPATKHVVRRIGGLLMPGLINAHAHTPMTLVRSAGDGLPLDRWLSEAVWPREANLTPEDVGWGMTLGSAEMLLAGVTTSCEMYFHDDRIIDAVDRSGARLVITPGALSVMFADGDLTPYVDMVTALHGTHHDPNGRITVGLAPHSPYNLLPEQIRMIGEAAQDLGVLLHIHLEETAAEREVVLERDGKTATQMLADQGVLRGPVLAAHGVWLDATDRRLLAEAGAAVAHCPVSNLKLGSGVAPVVSMLADGCGSRWVPMVLLRTTTLTSGRK